MTSNSYIETCSNRVFGKEYRPYLMGIAMIWIVLFHISYWYEAGGIGEPPWWIKIFAEGQLGVDIFFFLSAYGLEASIEKNSVPRFYCNRAKRLFPVYLLFLLILFMVYQRDCSLDMIFLQCLYQVNGVSLTKYADFFSTGFCFDWFTPAIISVYIFFPIISHTTRFFERKGFKAEALLLVVVIMVGHWIHMNKHFPLTLLAYRLPIVLLGIMTYRHLQRGDAERVAKLYLTGICSGFLCNEKAIILSLAVPLLLTVYSLTRFELPLKKFVCLVGRHSYEVYLGHIFIVAFFIPLGRVTNVLLLSVITIAGTALYATLLSLFQRFFYERLKTKQRNEAEN